MYGNSEIVTELWAVLNEDGSVKWSRGGSSTKPRLMVYPSENAARRALNNPWSKQVIPEPHKARVERVYSRPNRLREEMYLEPGQSEGSPK
jgi:hypothetical protein